MTGWSAVSRPSYLRRLQSVWRPADAIPKKKVAVCDPDHTRGDIYIDSYSLGKKDPTSVIIGRSSRVRTNESAERRRCLSALRVRWVAGALNTASAQSYSIANSSSDFVR